MGSKLMNVDGQRREVRGRGRGIAAFLEDDIDEPELPTRITTEMWDRIRAGQIAHIENDSSTASGGMGVTVDTETVPSRPP